MKKIFLPFLAVLLLNACSKQTNIDEIIINTKNDTNPDFTISFKNCEKGTGHLRNSLNLPGAATAEASWQIKYSLIRLEISRPEPNPLQWMGNIWVVIEFPGAKKPEDITGTYKFPGDNSKLLFTMYHVINGDTLKRQIPDFGKLEIGYDAATKTLNGKADKFIYLQPHVRPQAADELNVKFNHVHFKN